MALNKGGVMPIFDKGGVRHLVGVERDYIRGEHPTTTYFYYLPFGRYQQNRSRSE